MSNTKHFADLMKVCSILPALVIMPAMADLPNTSGNAWVFGDLNLGYETANNSAIGGRVSVVGDKRGNDFPNYNVVGRSANLSGTADERPNVYVGPVNLTLRELQDDEAFAYNWQVAGKAGESNWANTDLADGEVSYADVDIAKEKGIVWNDGIEAILAKNGWGPEILQEAPNMVYGLYLFAQRDATKTAGMLATNHVDLTLDGTKLTAKNVLLSDTTLNVVNNKVPANILNGIHNASDGKSKIDADAFLVKDNSRILVGSDAELDLTESDSVIFMDNILKGNKDGGAINVAANGELKVKDAIFQGNEAHDGGFGGAIWTVGKTTITDSTFVDNAATSGGAIGGSKDSTGLLQINNGTFKNNHAEDGGAVSAFKSLEIVGGLFEDNTAMYSKDDKGEYTVKIPTNNDPIGGGALALGARSDTAITSISEAIFRNNKSGHNGGAIGTRLAQNTSNGLFNSNLAKLDIAATFENNFAENNGGAIYNTFYSDNESGNGRGVTVAGIFDGNKAGVAGGAIYNDGRHDTHGHGGVMTINGAEFENNFASEGGAIYNTGALTINGGEFENNYIVGGNGDGGAIWSNGTLKISGADFSENYATANADGDYGYGGAIFARGDLVDISGASDEYAEFSENHALTGGAVYVSKHALTTNIENVEFEGNWASDIGALGIFGKNTTLTNLLFENNYTTGEFENFNDGAGALFFGSEAQAVLDNGMFISNKSAGVGGAIATRSPDKGNNSAAKLDIKNSTFRENVAATKGGAIYTAFYNSQEVVDHAYVTDTKFFANEANEGGAIYNEGLGDRGENYATIRLNNVTFGGNGASSQGGAIYNGAGGTVVLSGINEFTDNYAGKYRGLNDIHNLGTLNIAGGETTLGGGVTGTGTLTLAQGATLNIGTTTIRQNFIDIQGNVTLSVLNNQRGNGYGHFIGDVNVGDDASFTINVGAVGTYNILNGAIVKAEQISVGKIYEVADVTSDGVTITTKDVASIAQETGLSEQASGVVSGLANSGNVQLHQVSLAAQQALNSGDVALVERETSKLNPTDKPVAQAAATSVQNQVLSLASGRMSAPMPAVGRSGGDARSQENGFWIQGLFNKSKYADQFHGYTRGMALGADTLIDNKYTLGGGLAINSSDVHANARHTDIDSKTLFLYGQYMPNKWFVNGTLTYGMSEYTEATTVFGVPVSNSYDVDSYGAQVMTGYAFGTGITTDMGVRYLHVAQDGYNNGLHDVKAMDTDFLTGVAGVNYAFAIQNDWALQLQPTLHAAVTYDLLSDESVSTVMMPGGTSYQVGGERLSRLGGEFGIGLTANYKGVELSVMYDLDLHEDYTSQTGMFKLRAKF